MASLPEYDRAKWKGNKRLARANYNNLRDSVLESPGAAQRAYENRGGYAKRAMSAIPGGSIPGMLDKSKPFQQTVNILTGKIDPSQIVKYLFIVSLILIAMMFTIGFVRGILVSVDMLGCGVGNTGCSLPVIGHECTDCSAINMEHYYFMWDMEWIIRCLIYMCFALIVLTILYVWATWLFGKLLRFDLYVKKFDNWIYGFEWEGKAER